MTSRVPGSLRRALGGAVHPHAEQIGFFQEIEEVRTVVMGYFERYNQHWLLEKNGYRSPAETRRNWMAAMITTHEAA